MTRTASRRYLILLTMLVTLFAGAAAPATAAEQGTSSLSSGPTGPGPLPFLFPFSSCKDIHALFPFAPDGEYPVVAGNTLLTVYCHDMAGTPREYIDLVHTTGDANFSQYTAGGASPGTNVRTSFTKVRIDPATLTVDIGDLTFATSTGRLQHSSVTRGPSSPFVTSMPYGTAMSCTQRPDGIGNINLQGTPYLIDDTFQVRSFAGSGSANVSPDKQTADLTVSGYCGWISAAPAIDPGYNPQPGNFRLNLACAPFDLQTTRPGGQYCIKLS
jgi:GON domain